MNYIPLNIKTNYYLLHSLIKIDDLIDFAKKNKLNALTITDNNMYGVVEFYYKCMKNNIKPIIGLELSYPKAIILYAKNYNGYKNLLKIQTKNSEKSINNDFLSQHNSDLICIIPFENRSIYNELKAIYSEVYIGFKDEVEKEEIKVKDKLYMDEILCLENIDNKYLRYLKAIKEKKIITEIEIIQNKHLKLIDIDLTNNEIFNKCNVVFPTFDKSLPKFLEKGSFEYLKTLCKEGLIRIFGKKVNKIYIDRLKYELDVIHNMGFEDYFLIVFDYVKFAKEQGILVGPGRGSAAGSLVSYLLDITTVDPIKYDLLFERFLNPSRITMPDIDIDFDADRKDEVINYCIKKYGAKKVAPIITFTTLKARQVIKDVARALGNETKIVDILCSMLDRTKSLLENYKSEKIKSFMNVNPELNDIYKIAIKLENLKRQTSIHASSIVINDVDLEEVIPLDKHEDIYLTGYSMDYLEDLGLLKMDLLSISFLTLISDILKDIKKTYKKEIDFNDIDLNDQKVYDIFKSGNTIGIFQFESRGMINFLKKLKPNSFDDIVAAIALFRPGPMSNIDDYIKRKNGLKFSYMVKELEPILKSTYGIIIYQEQIMKIAKDLANYSLSEADLLRKAMSKKKEDILVKEKEKFIEGCVANHISNDKALEIYNLIFKFASYGFNKSHSVAYSIIAYRMAYLKLYYPEIFLKNLLSKFSNNTDKMKDYIYECKLNNVLFLAPDINTSTTEFVTENKKLRFPLSNIRNIGYLTANEIVKKREIPFKDIFDFVKKTNKVINKKVIESLIYAGCFDSLNYNRKTLIENLDIIMNYSEIGDILANERDFKPVLTIKEEYSEKELLQQELDIFGFYLTNHPISKYKDDTYDLKDLSVYFNKIISPVLYVQKIKEINTKNNQKMMFVVGSDEINLIDIVVFPDVIMNKVLEVGDIVRFTGRIEKRFDKFSLITTDFVKITTN